MVGKQPPLPPTLRFSCFSFLQATISITLLGVMDSAFDTTQHDFVLLIASFGASAVILHSTPLTSPIAQPYNVIVGHVVSAIAGVSVYKVIGHIPYIAAGLSVGLSIFIMEWTNSVHPPGGATSFLAVAGSDRIHKMGYHFVIFPAFLASLMMVVVAMLMNNLDRERAYPQYWACPSFPLRDFLESRLGRIRRNKAGDADDDHVNGQAKTIIAIEPPSSYTSISNDSTGGREAAARERIGGGGGGEEEARGRRGRIGGGGGAPQEEEEEEGRLSSVVINVS